MDNGQDEGKDRKEKEWAEMKARRSRKLEALPPGNPGSGGGGDYSGSDRKRARRQEGTADALKTVSHGDGAVKVSVQGNPMAKVKPNSGRANERGESSKAQIKVEGVKGGGEASSSSITGGRNATRSEIKGARRVRGEGDALKSAPRDVTRIASAQTQKIIPKVTQKLDGRANQTGKPALPHLGQDQVKVVAVKRVKVPSSSLPGGNTAARRSEMESSKGGPEEEEAHPCLFIENVLDVVFKHIIDRPRPRKAVAKDVQNIRLVCKTWRDSVTRAYRRKRAFATMEEYDMPGTKSLALFMKTMKCSEMIPVQKFKFGELALFSYTLELFGEFLRLCGPEVVSLELHTSLEAADAVMQSLRNLPDLKMPKLKTLQFHPFYYHRKSFRVKDKSSRGFVNLIEFLLIAATGLQEFDLLYPPPRRSSTYPQWQVHVMQGVGETIAKRIPGTVKEFKLSMEVNEHTFYTLANAGMKLERFEFGPPSTLGSMERRSLRIFLESQAASLKELTIWKPRVNQKGLGLVVDIPRLNELVRLWLPDATVRTRPFEFSSSFPKLRCLEIPGMSSQDAFRALLSSVKTPAQSLKVLHLPVWERASLAPLVKVVAQSFPSITELHIVLLHKVTRETMEEVFKYFDNLESLHISISERVRSPNWVDSIFSGMSEGDCSRIKRRQDFGAVNLNQYQRQPSLLDLTKLRKLVVHVSVLDDGGNRWIPFSNFSAHFVFLEMGNLREIGLANSDIQLSPRYLDLLRGKLALRG